MRRIIKKQNENKKSKLVRLIKSVNNNVITTKKRKINTNNEVKEEIKNRIVKNNNSLLINNKLNINALNKSKLTKLEQRIAASVTNTPPEIKTNNSNNKFDERINNSVVSKQIIKDEISYDAIIMISSYNRYKKLLSILNQLFTQETKFLFKVIVYNDGSTENYDELPILFPQINFINGKINNGKKKYWESITRLWKEIKSHYNTRTVIQIDDDFILCENFIDTVIDFFMEKVKINPNVMAISYHVNPDYKQKRWGFDDWVDGGALYSDRFLKKIDYAVEPISEKRWESNPKLSSGVWHQITKKIHQFGGVIVTPETSMAYHDGNEDSMMNSNIRKLTHIKTKNFKDGNSNS